MINKVVLAYSGGLDTSVILKWLASTYKCELCTFSADIGQPDIREARERALSLGVKAENIFIQDLREEFVRDYVFEMFKANALYEGEYLLGTSIARPLIAKKLVETAHLVGADAIAHGATGKGNDQVRFELGVYSLDPSLKIIAPWREWDLNSRTKLMQYAIDNGVNINPSNNKYSIDANLLHISYEGAELEDPSVAPNEDMWKWTNSISESPDEACIVRIGFVAGVGVSIDGEMMSPSVFWERLNELGARHGVGRVDIVENRFIGIKSRGCYETPGGTIYIKAHRALESICLDREEMFLKDKLMPDYARLVYNGFWFSKEREAMQALIDATQKNVSGEVTLKLHKGNVILLGRQSERSLFSIKHSTFEEDDVYDQRDAGGFIKINALRFVVGHHSFSKNNNKDDQ